MENTIQTTIDAAGRIVVPKSLRTGLNLKAGQAITVRLRGGVLEIEPMVEPVSIRKRGKFFVAERPGRPSLTNDTVVQTRSRLRDEEG